jgi:hypothetical protein
MAKKTATQAKAKGNTPAKATSTKTAKGSTKGSAKGQPKAPPKPKAVPVPTGPRHPRGKLTAAHGSKEALAKTLAAALARPDEDADVIAARLKTASNRQLLRLASMTETVKKKWGNREKLIAAIGAAQKKGKDQAYLARLDSFSLPRLVELAKTAERRARA